MKRIFEVDPWKVTTHKFSKEDKRLQVYYLFTESA